VRDSWGTSGIGETPKGAMRRGGSPHAPRKASNLERKSMTFKNNYEQLKFEIPGKNIFLGDGGTNDYFKI
jgi:hypothetical protein